ncbi:hypothetical protein INT48_006492 [Thamnidium elegans]|uniref:Uncharacterized protein n=1 Tax=Thamnidium elegans TaxID=101142 RepID=A0A8H7ST26_9FUNG|nr:hypothetical protein INT48_006492 [Thamnidium elegans]
MRTTLAYLLLSALIVNAAQTTNIVYSEQGNVAAPTPVVAQVVVIDKNDVLSIAADMAIAAALAANKEAAGKEPLVEGTAETPIPLEQDFEHVVEMEQPDSVVADNVVGEIDTIVQEDAMGDIAAEEEDFKQQELASSHKPSLVVAESSFTFSPITLAPESSRSAHRAMSTSQLALPRITASPAIAKVAKSNANSIWLTNYWEVIVPVLFCLLGQY